MTLRCVRAAAAAAIALATAAHADIHNGFHVSGSVNGSSFDLSGGLSSNGPGVAKTTTAGGASVDYYANATQFTAARAAITGSGDGFLRVKSSSTFGFKLQPPAGAPSVKGGKLVLTVELEGTATGNADLHLVTAVQSDFGKGTGSAIIADAATGRVRFDVETPIAPFAADLALIDSSVHMVLDATAKLAGSGAARAEATTGTRVVHFRVFAPGGSQVTGFTMAADGGNVPEAGATGPTPPPAGKGQAIEYFNASFGHYFVTASAAEIAKLDDGTFAGWTRTGQSFAVMTGPAAGTVPVCRFFTVAFPPTSSHFYAPRGLGCEQTLTNAKWQLEGDVFHVPLPGAAGTCPAGSVPVYRLYNNGRGGAPNHRFTTSEAVRSQMLGEGFVAEGAGVGIGFCAPQ